MAYSTVALREGQRKNMRNVLPFSSPTPVGMLRHEGHEIFVWALACSHAGQILLINCTGSATSVRAGLMQILKDAKATVDFIPSEEHGPWEGPTTLRRGEGSYTQLRSMLSEVGQKNYCLLAASLHIREGLRRPAFPQNGTEEDLLHPRHLLASEGADQPPQGTFYANLRTRHVVCLPEWEDILWNRGVQKNLIRPIPALGLTAWEMEEKHSSWTGLIREGCQEGWLGIP